jgi:hypothetical protein
VPAFAGMTGKNCRPDASRGPAAKGTALALGAGLRRHDGHGKNRRTCADAIVLLIAAAAALAACAPRTEWARNGATAEDLRHDREACAHGAGDFGFLDPGANSQQSIQATYYRDCMEARGWKRQRGGATASP